MLGFYERTASIGYSESAVVGGTVGLNSTTTPKAPACDPGDFATGNWFTISGGGWVTNNQVYSNGTNAAMVLSAHAFGDGTLTAGIMCADVTP